MSPKILKAIVLSASLLQSLSGLSQTLDGLKRTVELQWEEIKGATGYEIVVTGRNKKEDRYTVNEGTSWSHEFICGHYELNIRGLRKIGTAAWKESSLDVPLREVPRSSPKDQSILETQERQLKIPLSWQSLGNVNHYHLEVKDGSGKVVVEKDLQKTNFEFNALTGERYTWTVVARKEGCPTDSPQPWSFEIPGLKLAKPSITLTEKEKLIEVKWSTPKDAEVFDFVLERSSLLGWREVERRVDSTETLFIVDEKHGSEAFDLRS